MSSVSKYEWNKYQEQRNGTYKSDRHVQFASYDGKWPNLCFGKLTLNIDGEVVDFHYDHTKADYTSFWSSGGSCGFASSDFSDEYVISGAWIIHEDELPDKYKKYVDEIREVFNENVPYGCCGGCL